MVPDRLLPLITFDNVTRTAETLDTWLSLDVVLLLLAVRVCICIFICTCIALHCFALFFISHLSF